MLIDAEMKWLRYSIANISRFEFKVYDFIGFNKNFNFTKKYLLNFHPLIIYVQK